MRVISFHCRVVSVKKKKRSRVFLIEIKKNMRVIAVSCPSVGGVQYAPLIETCRVLFGQPLRVAFRVVSILTSLFKSREHFTSDTK